MEEVGREPLLPAEMKTKLRGYGIVDGVRTLRDSQIGQLFRQAKEEGILPWVMYSDHTAALTERDFINFYKDDSRLLWLVHYDQRLAGWVWLDDIGHRTARIHFGFFKWLSREKLTVRVARELLWQLLSIKFRGGVMLQLIRGETPTFNKRAVRFIERVGLKVIGEMPQAAYQSSTATSSSMLYSYITRDMLKADVLAYYLETRGRWNLCAHARLPPGTWRSTRSSNF